jgi:GT2 family glycosyltransferase
MPADTTDRLIVPANRWDLLVPADDHCWTPTNTVSICIPTRNPGPGLVRTLRALGAQTYPLDLLEVIVADDASDPAVDLGGDWPFQLQVVRHDEARGFGAGRARNTAAKAARGDILFFLDSDVVPERHVVEAYARWFERSPDVVVLGMCRFVDMTVLTTDELVKGVAAGSLGSEFAAAEVDGQEWRENTFRRTSDLTIEAIDAFRITIGATLAVSSEQFAEVGGFRELGVRGVEDIELGYRLHTNGAIFVLDRSAVHWHQGRRSFTTERRAQIQLDREPYVQRLLPVGGFRRSEVSVDGPVETVPTILVFVDPTDAEEADVAAAVRSVEEHGSHNVEVFVGGAPDPGVFTPAFAQMHMPAHFRWTASTLKAVVTLFRERGVGELRVVGQTEGPPITVVRTRALRRAGRCAGTRPLHDVVDELFGTWWGHVSSFGIVEITRDETDGSPSLEADAVASRPQQGGLGAAVVRTGRRVLGSTWAGIAGILKRMAR